MSFALTTQQILDETKDVTRRLGWAFLKDGELFMPVKKCMGLKPGEKIVRLRDPLRAIKPRREQLCRMIDDLEYGTSECIREGFPFMSPFEFIAMFCDTHNGCTPMSIITRIEFEYPKENHG